MSSETKPNPRLRIAVVVPGRLHAFDLSRELLRRGHDLVLFTPFPGFSAERFGIPKNRVRSFLLHGMLSRPAWRLAPMGLRGMLQQLSDSAFARWASRQVLAEHWDVVLAFSGVAEETFRGLAGRSTIRVLHRGSAHIKTQRQILDDEEARVGCTIEKPTAWIMAKECREYLIADVIHLLSNFSIRTFLDQGIGMDRLFHLPLGVDTRMFKASPDVIDRRCRRILAGEPLNILNVGTFCVRKGAWDWLKVIDRLHGDRFRFRFVGPIGPDAIYLQQKLSGQAEFMGRKRQSDLHHEYEWGDVFVLPTLEDGFALVLNQALASGLPIVTTANSAGPELICEGRKGWLIPIRDPQSLIDRLNWLDQNRGELAAKVRTLANHDEEIDWAETARRAEENVMSVLRGKLSQRVGQDC